MQCLNELESYQDGRRAAVTLGKFDGLHLGHQKLIEKVRRYQSDDVAGIVCAFDMGNVSLLTGRQRRERLEGHVDYLIACAFTKELREMEAERFIEEVLVQRMRAAHVVVGSDFCFGYQKRGDVEMLKRYEAAGGYRVDVVEKEQYQGRVISSTYVREELAKGNVGLAARLLGYPYTAEGRVEHGRRLGRKLGFPTMNILWDEQKIAPRFGVYACEVLVDGAWRQGICNVGIKPTVTEEKRLLVEAHVFDYQEDAYGKEICVRFREFERPEMKFASVGELKAQVEDDLQYGREYFAGHDKVVGAGHVG